MKEFLITSAFPRSGSTYLNQALNLLYYPKQEVNQNRHTVISLETVTSIMVAFRNPIDCISSWHKYPSHGQLDSDINYYVRFYKTVLNNLNRVVLMDFDYFVKDIDYIKAKVFKNFSIDTDNYVTDTQVKEAMLANSKEINLPRNNKKELDAVKVQLKQMSEFAQCVDLYKRLKQV